MRIVWPAPVDHDGGDRRLDDVDPVELVTADDRPPPAGRPWVLANMIASADGSATDPAGRSGGLAGEADRAMFSAIRGVADVIVAGAGTVTTEDYGPSRPVARVRELRVARGQAPTPRIAVTSASLAIEPTRRLFADATPDARPIVLTVAAADPGRRRALEKVADVHVVGDDRVDWGRAFALLHDELGARVVVCEGGPLTLGQLVADDLLDELCQTIAARMLAGPAQRIAHGPVALEGLAYSLARVVVDGDDLFLRYVRAR
jgi:riboflavin biosynthesis pyrimidine reductase